MAKTCAAHCNATGTIIIIIIIAIISERLRQLGSLWLNNS